jgi:hypothetical protein
LPPGSNSFKGAADRSQKRILAAHPLFQATAHMPWLLGAARLVNGLYLREPTRIPEHAILVMAIRALLSRCPVTCVSEPYPPVQDRSFRKNQPSPEMPNFRLATDGYLGNGKLVPSQVAESARPTLNGKVSAALCSFPRAPCWNSFRQDRLTRSTMNFTQN